MMNETEPMCADNPEEEQRWIERSRDGDTRAFKQLHTKYASRVHRLVVGMLRHEENAREVGQQVWIKVWNKLDTFEGKAAFSTWIYRIATYAALDFIRANRKHLKVDSMNASEEDAEFGIKPMQLASDHPEEQPVALLRRKEVMERFQKALEGLNEHHRTALVLREIEGLSYEEIAEVVDCKIGTVMSRIFNARRAIQQEMEEFR